MTKQPAVRVLRCQMVFAELGQDIERMLSPTRSLLQVRVQSAHIKQSGSHDRRRRRVERSIGDRRIVEVPERNQRRSGSGDVKVGEPFSEIEVDPLAGGFGGPDITVDCPSLTTRPSGLVRISLKRKSTMAASRFKVVF